MVNFISPCFNYRANGLAIEDTMDECTLFLYTSAQLGWLRTYYGGTFFEFKVGQ